MKKMKGLLTCLMLILCTGFLSSCEKEKEPADDRPLLDKIQGQWIIRYRIDNDNTKHFYPTELGVNFGYVIDNDIITIYQLRNGRIEGEEAKTIVRPDGNPDRLIGTVPVDELTITMKFHLQDEKTLVNDSRMRPESHVRYYLKKQKFKFSE